MILISVSFLQFSDIFKSDKWKTFQTNNNAKLKHLREILPETILKCRAETTINKYTNSFKKWIKWCDECNIENVFPAKDYEIALFLTSLIQSQASVSVTEGVYYSLKLAHDLALF